VPLSGNNIHYLISYAMAFLVFGLIAKWYLWAAIKDRPPKNALTPLLLYACLRVNGLMFLMPGLVSRELPRAFAGLLDLIYANISTFKDHVDPTYLGVSYYLAVLNVPAMVVVHVLIFAYLLRRPRS
jgi:hypothetical protein